MNRVAIAHLSIEKAIKYLIREAGGGRKKGHNLVNLLRELELFDMESASYLENVFAAAVEFYGFDSIEDGTNHPAELKDYLKAVGSLNRFNDIRYWELDDPLFERVELRQLQLSIHMELLYGLHEILIEPDRPKETVEDRVDRAVATAMSPNAILGFGQRPSTRRELSSYVQWIEDCGSYRSALSTAVRCDFTLGDNYASDISRAVYKSLLKSKDPAVRHFASTLDVLPRQSREIIPELEWLESPGQRKARVFTPAGHTLGYIEPGPHRLWYIIPMKSGAPEDAFAKAQSRTDAQCYLAQTLTRLAQVTVDGKSFTLRVVGEERHLFKPVPVQRRGLDEKMFTALFWDENHGIEKGQEIRIEAQRSDTDGPTFSDALSGHIQDVQGHQISVLGRSFTVVGSP